ncbi:MAG: 16S rRNA (guanine(527)-N(7))-methyltransferase RsmG [Alphaproteobacteria bacterium]|nr:16S rRNA (guanine(527)-N(7))-methyltransferase RsmG [Alphaproteobacteria bacterium]
MEHYEQLLLKWQKAINLVGPATLDDVAERHFFDSAQLFRYVKDVDAKLVDLGSGAGFPGIVLAMLGVREVHLVESDIRKATFLREVSRETGTRVFIHDVRAEDEEIADIDVITARALAPLKDLLQMVSRLATPDHPLYSVFPKGLNYQEEIEKAKKQWVFEPEIFPSETDLSGKILRIGPVAKKI